MYASLNLFFDSDQFCDSQINFLSYSTKTFVLLNYISVSLPLFCCSTPPCLLRQCGTYEMLFAMAFLCPVSPRESDRCSHRTWRPLVMHVSLDHPWWWPEVRKLLPFLWHENSFEFQHFYDSFGSQSNHSDIEVDSCNSLFISQFTLQFSRCFSRICHFALCLPVCVSDHSQNSPFSVRMPTVCHLTLKDDDLCVSHIVLSVVPRVLFVLACNVNNGNENYVTA